MFYLLEFVLRAYVAVLKWAVRSVARILLGIRDSFFWAYHSIRERPSRLIGLLAVLIPIGVLVTVGRREWFLNWSVMFFAALALYGALKSPLSPAPSARDGKVSASSVGNTAASGFQTLGRQNR